MNRFYENWADENHSAINSDEFVDLQSPQYITINPLQFALLVVASFGLGAFVASLFM